MAAPALLADQVRPGRPRLSRRHGDPGRTGPLLVPRGAGRCLRAQRLLPSGEL